MMRSWRERFVEVDRGYETPCLEWMGNRINGGYGQVQINGRKHYVHRLVWTEAHGDPGEQKVLHRCDNRRCGRLEHLFVGTQAANVADMIAKGRDRKARGKAVHGCKLDVAAVRAIRAATDVTQAALASRHGVSISVSAIRLGKRWAYVS